MSNPDPRKPSSSLHVFPTRTSLTNAELELALKTVDEGLSNSLDLWSINPPPELQKLSPEDWAIVTAIWERLFLEQQHSSLH